MNVLYCSEIWDLEKCQMEKEKLRKRYSVHTNCSQFYVYFFKLFQKIGSKLYQINKNRNSNFSKTCPSKCCCHSNIRPHNLNSTTSLNCKINLTKSSMIWKKYLKLSEIASYSKLARASKAPPPPLPPQGVIGLKMFQWYFVGFVQSFCRCWKKKFTNVFVLQYSTIHDEEKVSWKNGRAGQKKILSVWKQNGFEVIKFWRMHGSS